ncbi:60S ribosomal protein L37-1-like [Iris pallida]|uniref:60S ribosomal protein L37-1-like n=1 Tax=Iris pallida TaxID=29817 RepID=A0AAX6FL50_IRIPA|nr:60S ribosomal protein L37-1-like [Iris pallida]
MKLQRSCWRKDSVEETVGGRIPPWNCQLNCFMAEGIRLGRPTVEIVATELLEVERRRNEETTCWGGKSHCLKRDSTVSVDPFPVTS